MIVQQDDCRRVGRNGRLEHLARVDQDGVERPVGYLHHINQPPAGVEEEDLERLDVAETDVLAHKIGDRFRGIQHGGFATQLLRHVPSEGEGRGECDRLVAAHSFDRLQIFQRGLSQGLQGAILLNQLLSDLHGIGSF